jgi:hypothetical protein
MASRYAHGTVRRRRGAKEIGRQGEVERADAGLWHCIDEHNVIRQLPLGHLTTTIA